MNTQHDWLVALMDMPTHLGDGPIQIGLIAVVYWGIDRHLGVRMMCLLMFSGTMNGLLKQSFAMPRPGWVDAELLVTQTPSSFGMPSGHAQSAVTWLLWPLTRGGASAWAAAVLYFTLIGWSRVVIGVHSWIQVIIGWALGLCCVYAFVWAERLASDRLKELSGTALVIVLGSICLGTVYMTLETIVATQGGVGMEAWLQYAKRMGIAETPGPVGLRSIVAPLGCLAGFAIGELYVGRRCGRLPTELNLRAARCLLGLTLVAAVYVLVHAVLPVSGESTSQLVCRFFGAGALGATVSALAPWLFSRVGLGGGEEPEGADDAPDPA